MLSFNFSISDIFNFNKNFKVRHVGSSFKISIAKERRMIYGKEISLTTEGFSDIKDITSQVNHVISDSKIKEGIASITVIGSTASISTMEFEPALAEDIKDQLEEFIPKKKITRHSQTWGDDNGFSHIRSTFLGPGIVIPFKDSSLILGSWQQIVVIDHDNRPRNRKVYVQIIGE